MSLIGPRMRTIVVIAADFDIGLASPNLVCGQTLLYVVVRPLSTVGYTSVAASVIHSRQWSN